MKTHESFRSKQEHQEYLRKQNRRGKLEAETADVPEREAMLAQTLTADPAPGVYLEIGPAFNPYLPSSTRVFSKDVRYIGLDGGKSQYKGNDSDNLSFGGIIRGWTEYRREDSHDRMSRAVEKVAADDNASFGDFIWADAQQLPFPDRDQNPDHPIRETFMRDVLMVSGIHQQSLEQICDEQARVLDKDGQLIIRETSIADYYGYLSDGSPSTDFLALLVCLENAGFRKRTILFEGDEGFSRLEQQYPTDEWNRKGGGYYLICEQGEPPVPPESRNLLGKLATALRIQRK